MTDAKLIEMLTTDLRTGGHWLGEEVQRWSDEEIVRLYNVLDSWRYAVSRDLTRRAAGLPIQPVVCGCHGPECNTSQAVDRIVAKLTARPAAECERCPTCGQEDVEPQEA